MNQAIIQTVEDLRAELAQAQQRERALAQEQSEMSAKIQEAARQAASQRAEAARRGESAATVAADLDLEGLRQRRQQLPLELWAQRVAATEAEIAFYEAEDQKILAKQQQAQARFEQVKARYEPIKAEYDAARAAANADGLSTHRMDLKREARAKLKELSSSFPGGLDA